MLTGPALVQLCMGVPWGAPDDLNTFMAMVNNVPADWHWSAFSLGRNQMPFVAAAVLAGGNVRVGLEDNLWLGKGAAGHQRAAGRAGGEHRRGPGRAGDRPAGGAREAGAGEARAGGEMSGARKAAIIGGGVIGGGWAARFLLNGWDVARVRPGPGGRAQDRRPCLPTPAPRCRCWPTCRCRAEGRAELRRLPSPRRCTGAAYMQESVSERLELKHRVFAEIQAGRAGSAGRLLDLGLQAVRPAAGGREPRHRSSSPTRSTRSTCCRWWSWCPRPPRRRIRGRGAGNPARARHVPPACPQGDRRPYRATACWRPSGARRCGWCGTASRPPKRSTRRSAWASAFAGRRWACSRPTASPAARPG